MGVYEEQLALELQIVAVLYLQSNVWKLWDPVLLTTLKFDTSFAEIFRIILLHNLPAFFLGSLPNVPDMLDCVDLLRLISLACNVFRH